VPHDGDAGVDDRAHALDAGRAAACSRVQRSQHEHTSKHRTLRAALLQRAHDRRDTSEAVERTTTREVASSSLTASVLPCFIMHTAAAKQPTLAHFTIRKSTGRPYTFQLDGVHAALLHHAHRRRDGVAGAALVAAERQVAHQQRPPRPCGRSPVSRVKQCGTLSAAWPPVQLAWSAARWGCRQRRRRLRLRPCTAGQLVSGAHRRGLTGQGAPVPG
jgi:hypothetical protein